MRVISSSSSSGINDDGHNDEKAREILGEQRKEREVEVGCPLYPPLLLLQLEGRR